MGMPIRWSRGQRLGIKIAKPTSPINEEKHTHRNECNRLARASSALPVELVELYAPGANVVLVGGAVSDSTDWISSLEISTPTVGSGCLSIWAVMVGQEAPGWIDHEPNAGRPLSVRCFTTVPYHRKNDAGCVSALPRFPPRVQ